jgi:hypothetical protein
MKYLSQQTILEIFKSIIIINTDILQFCKTELRKECLCQLSVRQHEFSFFNLIYGRS